jgi:hypothetical protein
MEKLAEEELAMVAEVTMDDGRDPIICCRFDPNGCW